MSGVRAMVYAVETVSSPSQFMRKTHTVTRRLSSSLPLLAVGVEMTMLTPTVRAALTLVLVEVRLVLGEGVPPRAERVVEGEGELLEEGRLVMEALG